MEKNKHEPFTEEERRNIIEYGKVLRRIHDRLVREGYFMPSGKVWNIFKCTDENGKIRRNLV